MNEDAAGKFIAAGKSSAVDATAFLCEKELKVRDADGKELARVPLVSVEVSSKLANVPRTLTFPNRSVFETKANETIDLWLYSIGKNKSLVAILEGKLRYVLACALIAVLIVWAFVSYGIPTLAGVAARQIPDDFLDNASEFSLEALDRLVLEPSELDAPRRSEIRSLIQTTFPGISSSGHQLLFRRGADLGANAFALPDGVIVFTDELIELLESDDEILAVFAHEYGHVVERHSLRQLLQDSAIAILSFLIIGEATDTLQESLNALPAVLMHDAYSREFETEADAFAFRMLSDAGLSPALLGEALQRLSAEHGGDQGLKYFSSHPPFEERIRNALEASR